MDIEWWEIVVAALVAGGILWVTSRKTITLGLDNPSQIRFRPHAEAAGNLKFGGSNTAKEQSVLRQAHDHSFKTRPELEKSELCGCFYCEKTFSPAAITEWIDDGQTAMCPFCGIDSVIGSASGFELSKDFLHRMNERWF